MRAKLTTVLVALLIIGSALAETLVVYPLSSQDTLIGVAIADRVAAAFERGYAAETVPELEVFGPLIAPSLVPPMVAEGGFVNPLAFLGAEDVGTFTGAALVRDALGADLVVTGSVSFSGDDLELTLFLGDRNGVRRFVATAPEDRPGQLAAAAVAAVAGALGLPVPRADTAIDLSTPYGSYVRAVALLGAGLLGPAETLMDDALRGDQASDDLEALRAELEFVLAGEQGGDPATSAALSLSREEFDSALAIAYFEAFERATELPAASAWVAALSADVNDRSGANAAFDRAAGGYLYGRAARATYRLANGLPGAEDDVAAVQRAATDGQAGVASLLALGLAAQIENDLALEKSALETLARTAPFFSYPFERLSFIAFDEGDGLAAAKALAVAVSLEPDSDLYWTNLGWAYYLSGLLAKSEEASLRAIDLDPSQFIAYYNLGLVRAVTGRLADAMPVYQRALEFDPGVDDEAIGDLETALELFPDEPGVHYALATLYEAEGRRAEAADQFELFASRSPTSPFAETARARVEVLRAPPPPIEISGAVALTLGPAGSDRQPFHPGDTVFPSFEIYTPGEELPTRLEVTLSLRADDGTEVLAESETVEVPKAAIGFVVDRLGLTLPDELEPGAYTLAVEVGADGDRRADAAVPLEVAGGPELLRQLLGRSIVMQAFETNRPLYGTADLDRPDRLVGVLLDELRATAELAEEALPEVTSGRFEGLSGGEVFGESSAEDVVDFLAYLLARNTRDTTFTFVDAYAQWAVQGAPSE